MNKLIIFLIGISLIPLVFAFPLQILPNGTLIEINESINGTPVDFILYNNTIYIIEKNLTNYTIYQNISYINMTCINCTNYYNDTYKNTYNDYGYNKSYVDNNFVTNSLFDTYKLSLSYATKDELTNSINSLNNTKIDFETFNPIKLWIGIGIVFLIELGIVIFIYNVNRGV